MIAKTRYFVIVSLLVLLVGVGTGLVAYYIGFPGGAVSAADGPDELRFVPRDATLIAFANVSEIMTSGLRDRVRRTMPGMPNEQERFREETGINIETDIDSVVVSLSRRLEKDSAEDDKRDPAGLMVARGRFDQVRIQALMREHGATVEDYRGKTLISAPSKEPNGQGMALTYIEPGVVAAGDPALVRNAIDLTGGGSSVTGNEDIMKLIRALDGGNAWAVGRFDALASQARLPGGLAEQLPTITWFSASGRVDGGVSGVLRAETRDEESANNLRDVARGFLALAKLQSAAKPELQTLVDSLELGGTGATVALSFNVPAEIFDLLGQAAGPRTPAP
jgi:hypothetical protein